jgi:hypothetical protein
MHILPASDRRLSILTFVVFAVAFHKYTHEGWRVLLESFGFRHGIFGSSDWLGNFRTASERAVIDWLSMNLVWEDNEHVFNRLIQNQTQGILSAGISLNLEGSYQSQIGLGSWLLTLPATFLGLTGTSARFLTYSLVAVLNASIATTIVSRARRTLSIGATTVVVLLMLQPMILSFAASPFLVIGLRFLPSLWIIRQLSENRLGFRQQVPVHLLLVVLAFSSGYGWVSIVPAMSLAAVGYFAVRNSWSWRQSIRLAGFSLISTVGGLVFTLLIHLVQLGIRYQDLSEGWRRITYALTKRTGSGGGVVADSLLLEALAASPRLVLDWYLSMPAILAPARVPVIGNLTVGILIGVCIFIVLHDLLVCSESNTLRNRQALGIAWVVSLLGPMGWILLFRPTVYIHTHIDGAVWYFPTIPLGALLVWQKFSGAVRRPTGRTTIYVCVLTAIALVIGALYFVSWVLVTPRQ